VTRHDCADSVGLTEQPATALVQGRLTKVPVIVGSNSDEATVTVGNDLRAAPTLANYKAYLKSEFENDTDADELFRMYPAATDADARSAFIRFDTDYNFGFAVHRLALDAATDGQYTRVFIVVGEGVRWRRCLVCEQVFSKQASYEHSKTICYPPASSAN